MKRENTTLTVLMRPRVKALLKELSYDCHFSMGRFIEELILDFYRRVKGKNFEL